MNLNVSNAFKSHKVDLKVIGARGKNSVWLENFKVPCGPSMMDYPETSVNLQKLAAGVSNKFPYYFY